MRKDFASGIGFHAHSSICRAARRILECGTYRLTDCKIVRILECSIDFDAPLSIFNHMQGTDSLHRETYSTDEAAKELGLSKSTLLRWFREGRISDVKRDRNNWRVFTAADIERIRKVL